MIGFFFPENHRKGLPIGLVKRIPILINLNVILVLYFIFASFTRYRADPVNSAMFFYAVMATNMLFFLSFASIRSTKYLVASWLSMIGLLLNSLWIGIFLPSIGSGDLYRLVLYLVASKAVNSMVSIDQRQIILYGIAGYLVVTFSTFAIYAPRFGSFSGELSTVFVTMTLLYVPLTIVFLFTNKLSTELIVIAEKELAKNKAKAISLNLLIRKATDSMEIGKQLLGYTEDSNTRGKAMKQALATIKQTSGSLSGASGCADDTNEEILNFADQMKEAITNQNGYLETASEAFQRMITSIQQTSTRAEAKQTEIESIIHRLESQAKEISSVIDSFQNIRNSSQEVLSVASGILDVSEKTNLLAMNASIEAAHAGSSGKGFAVIAGEIRKLSQETKSNTQAIAQALHQNDVIVNQSAQTLTNYSKTTKSLVQDIQHTFTAIQEIIQTMTVVATSSQDIQKATSNMIELAQSTKDHVADVNSRLQDSTDSLAHISTFACQLDDKIQQLTNDVIAIEGVIEKVRTIGEENIRNIQLLEQDLAQVLKDDPS
jgi:methyl-accepting chemotaxis protein